MLPREIDLLRLAKTGELTTAALKEVGRYGSMSGPSRLIATFCRLGFIERYRSESSPIVKRWYYRLTSAGERLCKQEGIGTEGRSHGTDESVP